MNKTDPTNKSGVKVKRLFFRNNFQTTLFRKHEYQDSLMHNNQTYDPDTRFDVTA